MRGVAFFSGGKDSIFAVMKARENNIPVDYLLFNTHSFPTPNPHEINNQVVGSIARLVGVPLKVLHLEAGREYASLVKLFSDLDIGVVVIGNINVRDQIEWYERLCLEAGVALYAPLWSGDGRSSLSILIDELKSGVKAMICGIMKSVLPAQFLGRVIDYDLAESLADLIDPCGEGGEYHTIVLEAPLMSGRVIIEEFSKIEYGDRVMLKVEKFRAECKK